MFDGLCIYLHNLKVFQLKRTIYTFILFLRINVYLYIDIKKGTLCISFLQLLFTLQIVVFDLIPNWIDNIENGTRKCIK